MRVINWILKRKLMVSALLVVMITAQAQHTGYISNHKTITTELAEQYGIPSSVILAVALVESSSGESKTAKKLNNHFGIVGRNHMKTQGYHTKYKQYDNEKESFVDFCKTISSKNFYARLKDNADTKEWIKAISKAGYSEQPKVWEKKVLNVIEDNKL